MGNEQLDGLSGADWRTHPLNLLIEKQSNCTNCGSPDVEWLNQFCTPCWEMYTTAEWSVMIEEAISGMPSSTIVDNSQTEDI